MSFRYEGSTLPQDGHERGGLLLGKHGRRRAKDLPYTSANEAEPAQGARPLIGMAHSADGPHRIERWPS
jgi:hypothetical protein